MSSPQPDDQSTIVEEYKLWRKNSRYMYNYISETALVWPSLSFQFFPLHTFQNKQQDTESAITHNIALSTFTSESDKEYWKVGSLQLPKDTKQKRLTSDELVGINSRLKISKKFEQSSEINRIRVNPIDSNVIGTINAKGEVKVYQLNEKMEADSTIELIHHEQNGFGLSWNPHDSKELLTGSEDKTCALWDYSKPKSPVRIWDASASINDIRWVNLQESMFGSVSEDKKFYYGDTRTNGCIFNDVLNGVVFNSLCFSTHSANLVAFGGDDSNVYLYDLRMLDRGLHTMMGHSGSITNIEWDPWHENVIGSSSLDRRVILWDISKIGEEQLPEEMEDGVPELLMMHGGHTGGVNDFAFNKNIEWCLGSCSDDNIVHVWVVDEKAVKDHTDEVDYTLLE
ncbi:Hat2 protein [Martiniozyma asiatica (nom. inval.)]|nr:Hat2 protein [Martiniozyma asiatica]